MLREGRRRGGTLRQIVRVQSRKTTGYEQEETWEDVLTKPIHAEIRPLGGREREAAHAMYPAASYEVKIRYNDAVTNETRLLWVYSKSRTRPLDVLEIPREEPDGRPRRWMLMLVKEGPSHGS